MVVSAEIQAEMARYRKHIEETYTDTLATLKDLTIAELRLFLFEQEDKLFSMDHVMAMFYTKAYMKWTKENTTEEESNSREEYIVNWMMGKDMSSMVKLYMSTLTTKEKKDRDKKTLDHVKKATQEHGTLPILPVFDHAKVSTVENSESIKTSHQTS